MNTMRWTHRVLTALAALCVLGAALSLAPATAQAVPAAPFGRRATQPDGMSFTYYVRGDESFSFAETASGQLIQRDPETGAWRFVVGDEGRMSLGDLVGTPAAAALDADCNGAEATYSGDLTTTSERSAYAELGGGTYAARHAGDFPTLSLDALAGSGARTRSAQTSIPLVVVVVGFEDMPYQDSYDWAERLFEGTHSVGAFWDEASGGRFSFSPAPEASAYGVGGNTNVADAADDGIVHVTLPRTHGNWGGNWTEENECDMMDTFQAALVAASELVDFARFDADGDGRLQNDELALIIVAAGHESAFSNDWVSEEDGNDRFGLWAHAASNWGGYYDSDEHVWADGFAVDNGLVIEGYIAMGEYYDYGAMNDGQELLQASVATACHELGHYVGLPDLYDVYYGDLGGDWRGYTTEFYSLMCSGNWLPLYEEEQDADGATLYNPNQEFVPSRLDPYCRMRLGYLSEGDGLTTLTETSSVDVRSMDDEQGYQAYLVPTDEPDEFFIIENRTFEGFDVGLRGKLEDSCGSTGGIVVYHVDETMWDYYGTWNVLNTSDHRPAVSVAWQEMETEDGPYLLAWLYNYYLHDGDITMFSCLNSETLERAAAFSAQEGYPDIFQTLWCAPDDVRDHRYDSGVRVDADVPAASSMRVTVTVPEPGAGTDEEVRVLFTNDVHAAGMDPEGEGLTYASVAALRASAEAEVGADSVTLVDAGDAAQGGPITTLTEGLAAVDVMRAVGYDYAVPGNHEFDYGWDGFEALVEAAAATDGAGEPYTYLSSNLYGLDPEEYVLAPYALEAYGAGADALRVAYVGITTPETLFKSSPAAFQNEDGTWLYSFGQDETGEELYGLVQAAVDDARAAGADYVVAVAHLGEEGVTDRWTSSAVIAHTTGIDAVIDGHSHERYERTVPNAAGEDVLLVQTGTKLASVGQLTITEDGIASEFFDATYPVRDEGVNEVLASLQAEFAEELGRVVAHAETDLAATGEDGAWLVRTQETNLGDLIADAYRSALGADIGLANGGGIRADLAAGDVTYGGLLSVQPYGNELCLVRVTGQEILDALELSVSGYPEPSGGFLQVSGLTFAFDPSVTSTVEVDENGAFTRVAGARRVSDVRVAGEPLDPTATYTVASHSYLLLEGGDGYVMFQGCEVLLDRVMLDNQAVIDYVTDELGGVIGTGYESAQGAGRITVREAAQPGENPGQVPGGGTSETGGEKDGAQDRNDAGTAGSDKVPATGEPASMAALLGTAGAGLAALGCTRLRSARTVRRRRQRAVR